MPKGAYKPKSETATNEPASPAGAPPTGGPSDSAKSGSTVFDVTKYRHAGTTTEPAPEQKAQRAKRPRVKWDELGGIDGFGVRDVWTGTNDEYGDYIGTVLVAPDGAEAVALTNAETAAGRALLAALNGGKFDALDGRASVPVHVRLRKSPTHPEGRPMCLLTFG
jgi:hypothetical protein